MERGTEEGRQETVGSRNEKGAIEGRLRYEEKERRWERRIDRVRE